MKYTDPSGHEICDEDGNCWDHGKKVQGVRTGTPPPYYLNKYMQSTNNQKSSDTDGDGLPDSPDTTVKRQSTTGCDNDQYAECFYTGEYFQIDGKMYVDDEQFFLLLMAIFFDIKMNVNKNFPVGRGSYDTPFWDNHSTLGGEVCFSDGNCYGRSEVNYIAQGMISAAMGEPLDMGEGWVYAWKGANWTTGGLLSGRGNYPSPQPSAGTLYWFEYGYNMFIAIDEDFSSLPYI